MGLGISLNNALTGMQVGNNSLEVLSRNIANAGTPGYHRQSLTVIDRMTNSAYAQSGGLERAFNTSLQTYYTRQVSDTGYANARASLLDQLQTSFGMPGSAGSLDTVLGDFRNAMSAMATSPDDPTARADALGKAQTLAQTLNRLSRDVQTLRQDAETQIGVDVGNLNEMLQTLEQINGRLSETTSDPASRANMLDQRDRLVAQVSELIGVRADYRENGTVALTTSAGIGLLDAKAGRLEFSPVGRLTAGAVYDVDPTKSGVGQLTLVTPSGLRLDLVAQGGLQSGQIAGLVELRDKTLVQTQAQLDQIAAGVAQAFSTNQTAGTGVTVGAAAGFDLDLSAIRPGNDFVLNYTQGGADKTLKVVRVDDSSKLPMQYVDADGVRVIGLDFSGGAASVASQLGGMIPGLAFSAPGGVLRVLDDGAAGTTDVRALTARTTVTALRDGGPALSLFVDTDGADFTNSLDGAGQRTGFAGRIAVNGAVLADNRILVQHVTGAALGDATRADYLLGQMGSMRFNLPVQTATGTVQLNGNVSDLVNQTLNYQGGLAATALNNKESQALTLESLNLRLNDEYGVNIDEEMGRLMELQNAFAANARVVSIVQELLDTLMAI